MEEFYGGGFPSESAVLIVIIFCSTLSATMTLLSYATCQFVSVLNICKLRFMAGLDDMERWFVFSCPDWSLDKSLEKIDFSAF